MTVRITKPEINFREKISELDFDKVPYDKMPYGSIIQVTAGETEYRTATSSSTYQPTDMYATITPRFASSKIYITLGGDGNNNGNGYQLYMTYYRHILGQNKDFENLATNGRNDSNAVTGNAGFAMINAHSSRIHVPVAMPFLDSPNTTSQVTYKVYIRNNGTGSVEFPANDGYQRSRMFLFEISSGYTPSSAVGS
tara:strand:- start:995 stop:1582 length:588 start_codon:yes stop_codon:yes gene_type:complete